MATGRGISLVILILACAARIAQAAPLYHLTEILALPGGANSSFAYDINSNGQIVGDTGPSGADRSFLWTNGSMQNLGDLPGGSTYTIAYGVNQSAQVVGESGASTGTRAFLWTSGGGIQDLGDLPGGGDLSIAYDINSGGQIVGYSQASTGDRAFLWTSGGGMQNLGHLPGGSDYSYANAINSGGQVVGLSNAGSDHAFIWTGATGMKDLGSLEGIFGLSEALDINDSGQVVGYSTIAPSGSHAFLWTPSTPNGVTGTMSDLGDLPGGANTSQALGINASGQVVGLSSSSAGTRAFLWTSSMGMVDLNSLLDASGAGWTLTSAQAINDAGQIVGFSSSPDHLLHGFLLTPVPEPSTLALSSSALIAFFTFAYQRRALRERRAQKGLLFTQK